MDRDEPRAAAAAPPYVAGEVADRAPAKSLRCGSAISFPAIPVQRRATIHSVDKRHQPALLSLVDTMTRGAVPDLLPGTLDLLILRTLQTESLHGWKISERIQQISQDVLQINQGSLYPALHRLEHRGWIESKWAVSELGRRAKYYRLTASGRRQLAVEASEWERMSTAIGRVMKLA